MYYKYPRTPHLPFSLGTTSDDRLLSNTDHFKGMEIVVTEKLDGEGTSMYPDKIHARSIISGDHDSRHWVKGLWGQIRYMIPEGWRICGENVYAKHSILYNDLETYFYVFGIYDNHNICLSWKDTKLKCSEWGLKTVPEIKMLSSTFKESHLEDLGDFLDITKKEGFVIRNADAFNYEDHYNNVAKWVRPRHVQSSSHWMTEKIVPNKLRVNG